MTVANTSIIPSINSQENIVSILKKGSHLKKEGALFYCRCPKCSHCSMVSNEGANICYCFSCNFGGSPVDVILQSNNLLFKELAMFTETEEILFNGALDQGNKFILAYEIATNHYQDMLASSEGEVYRDYLLSRGLTDKDMITYRLGLCINARIMIKEGEKHGISIQDFIDFGILTESGNDKFYKRILFPLIDYRNHVVGFTGRSLDSEPKYLNSPRSPMYDKSTFLYGFNTALDHIIEKKSVVLVEGQMDTIALQSHGIPFTVGVSGTAFTDEHVVILRRLIPNTGRVTLGFDSDEAGIKATHRAITMLSGLFEIFVTRSMIGKDASEHFQIGGKIKDFETISADEFLLLYPATKGT